MKHLIVGYGEVGQALHKIFPEADFYDWKISTSADMDRLKDIAFDAVHICFPYFNNFEQSVSHYSMYFQDALVIVHSSVPVGTCDRLGVVHSPVRGVHPQLEQGIRTFVKFFGGARAPAAAKIFRDRGIKTMCSDSAADTEALKLWDTTIYGWNILIEKAIHAYCEEHGLDFGIVYKLANLTYNEGYEKLGRPEFKKYVLKDYPGPIGGHCVRENWELLRDPIAEIAKSLHKQITDPPADV
jgi:hypothetical protein